MIHSYFVYCFKDDYTNGVMLRYITDPTDKDLMLPGISCISYHFIFYMQLILLLHQHISSSLSHRVHEPGRDTIKQYDQPKL